MYVYIYVYMYVFLFIGMGSERLCSAWGRAYCIRELRGYAKQHVNRSAGIQLEFLNCNNIQRDLI